MEYKAMQSKRAFYSAKQEALCDEWLGLEDEQLEILEQALRIVVEADLQIIGDGSFGARCQLRALELLRKFRK